MKKNDTLNQTFYSKCISFISSHKAILIVMILLVVVRIFSMYELGIEYNLNSDDLSYIKSGIYFSKTGTITMHNEYPSAQIMPGMTVLIGLLSLIFGEGKLLWVVLKLLWIAMGTLSAWYIYRSVSLFTPKWCGVIAALPLFRPDYIWMDCIILTETPFILCLVAMVYYTLKMGIEKKGYKYFWLCAIAYMGGLMLKANIALYPIFALIYLLIVKYDRKLLLKQCAILAGVVLCFVIPWSIRNYIRFNAFIPLTYGAGNPTLLGTYQGMGYPLDEELDYETNVYEVTTEKYAEYYDENSAVKPEYKKYISLLEDEIKATYRQKEWLKKDYKSFFYSLIVQKPRDMLNSVFYWKSTLGIGHDILYKLPFIENILCIFAIVAAVILKKHREPIFYTLAVYLVNIYIYAATFSFDRYNVSLVYLKYIALGISIGLFMKLIVKGYKSVIEHDANQLQ